MQMNAEANSSVDNSIWGRIERGLNNLTGGASRAILLSPEFTRALNAIDGFFAGVADALTAGLSTRLRAAMWGETATQNHTGGWFLLGQGVGFVLSIPLMAANPCSLGIIGNIGLRVINGLQLIGNGISAVENIMAGNYLAAGLNVLGMLGNLTQLSRACFTGDTKLIARGAWGCGWRRIDQITPDDEVLSRDEFNVNAPVVWKRVEETFVRFARIMNLHVRGQVIRTTAEHPFYVYEKGWVDAGELQIGDLLSSHDGKWVFVEDLCDTDVYETVYNMRVAECHTYFVGCEKWEFTVWAHNSYARTFAAFAKRYPHLVKGLSNDKAQKVYKAYLKGARGRGEVVIGKYDDLKPFLRKPKGYNLLDLARKDPKIGAWTLRKNEAWMQGAIDARRSIRAC